MKTRYLTFMGTALALTISSGAAQSSIAAQIELSQASPAPQTPTQPAPAPQAAPPTQSPGQTPVQPSPQAQVSQEELQKFASVVKKLQPIQQQAQSQITQAIQKQELSEKRFGEIYQSKQNPQAQPTAKVTPEENKKFEQANSQIEQIQQSTQTQMEQTVKSEGLEIQRFNEIFLAIRRDPQMLKKVQQMIQS